jgi:hypothetical protein
MADELTLSLTARLSKGSLSKSFSSGRLSIDVTGTNVIDNVQAVGTSEEVVNIGEAAAGGYLIAQNLDTTNYVEIRPNTGVADLVKLKAGEVAMFRTAADAVPYAIANTAACNVRFIIIPA